MSAPASPCSHIAVSPDGPGQRRAGGRRLARPEPLLVQHDQPALRVLVHHPHHRPRRVGAGHRAALHQPHEQRAQAFDHVRRPAELPGRLVQADAQIDLRTLLERSGEPVGWAPARPRAAADPRGGLRRGAATALARRGRRSRPPPDCGAARGRGRPAPPTARARTSARFSVPRESASPVPPPLSATRPPSPPRPFAAPHRAATRQPASASAAWTALGGVAGLVGGVLAVGAAGRGRGAGTRRPRSWTGASRSRAVSVRRIATGRPPPDSRPRPGSLGRADPAPRPRPPLEPAPPTKPAPSDAPRSSPPSRIRATGACAARWRTRCRA